jgi:hypothetical protein
MALEQGVLKELIHYEPDTGVFTWRVDRAYAVKAGDKAGYVDGNGYVLITVDNVMYRANRLAWLYMTGEWPEGVVDHKNRIRTDNCWNNLRDVPHGVNCQNRSVSTINKSGKNGVYWNKSSEKWHAQITLGKKKHHLGFFDQLEHAIDAREVAEKMYFTQP